jgi:ribosome-interacting GTPase 1
MPANLSPEYRRAEDRLRASKSVTERIEALEEMLRVIPKHKGTDHMQADLKSRIAKLRKDSGKKSGKAGFSYIIPREGAGQVALAGPPNTGKSSLVRALTHATPAVGEYPFTTREAVPGMMPFEDIAFQLIDLPPLSEQHLEPWILDVMRYADLVWLVLDGERAIEGFDEARRVLDARNVGLYPAGTAPRYITASVQKKALIVLTGLDKPGVAEAVPVVEELLDRRWTVSAVSCPARAGFDELGRRTFQAFDIMRVYTKQPGKPRDATAPFALPREATVGDLAERIHKDLVERMTFARVWGRSAFDGQAVQKDHVLAEGDIDGSGGAPPASDHRSTAGR